MMQELNAFPTIPDPRTRLETIVRPDTTALNYAAVYGAGGFASANDAIAANTIDTPNTQSYTLWSPNGSNTAWFLRPYLPNAILAPGC